jgi:hypothetical protein
MIDDIVERIVGDPIPAVVVRVLPIAVRVGLEVRADEIRTRSPYIAPHGMANPASITNEPAVEEVESEAHGNLCGGLLRNRENARASDQ